MLARSSAVRAAIARPRVSSRVRGSVMAGRYGWAQGMTKGGAPLRSPPFRWVVRSALPAP